MNLFKFLLILAYLYLVYISVKMTLQMILVFKDIWLTSMEEKVPTLPYQHQVTKNIYFNKNFKYAFNYNQK